MGKRKRGARVEQQTFGRFWGHRRKGGGRKRSADSGVSHLRREEVDGRHPVHVTLKVVQGLPKLRRRACLVVIAEGLDKARSRPGRLQGGEFRLVHYSIQDDHLHLIVEAKDRTSLSRGMQGLSIRIARGLNRLFQRTGKLFADRYHAHVLRSPREVRNALRYVLLNARKHGKRLKPGLPDPFTSGPWFHGWRDWTPNGWLGPEGPIVAARSWLLTHGWLRHGPLQLSGP